MKKKLFVIGVILILIVCVLVSIVFIEEKVDVTVVPKAYSFVSTYYETDEIEVLVYVSSKKSFLTKENNIKNAYIINDLETDSIKLDFKRVRDRNYKTNILGEKFYLYSFIFDIPFVVNEETELSINNAKLSIEYPNYNVNLDLGSFYYYKVPYYGDYYDKLSIAKLKPTIGYINGNKTISGINIKLSNNTDKDMVIKSFKILDNNIYPSVNDIKTIDKTISSLETISSVLGYKYELVSDVSVYSIETDLLIPANESIEYIIPIKYLNEYEIDNVGFIISYDLENSTSSDYSKLYYDNFLFFTDPNQIVDETKLVVSTYENH